MYKRFAQTYLSNRESRYLKEIDCETCEFENGEFVQPGTELYTLYARAVVAVGISSQKRNIW